ncbi:MAG: hypothetical protein COX30_01170 [Candidatus Moranbacteria bacterium CG23_combo_of_CG06-09_8_20_14_all_39_10]|nr:MAG: hypothetical protein COX30_01170 [Candidatus Moranbacteria bacterium CG23_combo_of_CG06-09_8_20_14_all_39_10]
MKEFIQSRTFKIIAAIIGVFLISVVSFGAGVAVGLHKARFSADFGKNYERNFMGSRFGSGRGTIGGNGGGMMGFFRDFEGRDFRNGYGLSGIIISVTDNNVIIKDRDNKENTVTVSDQTLIKSQRDNLKLSDLKVNDQIVVMGNPGDNGVVNASLIRVFPNPITN